MALVSCPKKVYRPYRETNFFLFPNTVIDRGGKSESDQKLLPLYSCLKYNISSDCLPLGSCLGHSVPTVPPRPDRHSFCSLLNGCPPL